jgi:diadenosine tetraphosphatase ApaH/serine/threonine PP2A family protein phosphatase
MLDAKVFDPHSEGDLFLLKKHGFFQGQVQFLSRLPLGALDQDVHVVGEMRAIKTCHAAQNSPAEDHSVPNQDHAALHYFDETHVGHTLDPCAWSGGWIVAQGQLVNLASGYRPRRVGLQLHTPLLGSRMEHAYDPRLYGSLADIRIVCIQYSFLMGIYALHRTSILRLEEE